MDSLLLPIIMFAAGLLFIIKGGDWFVESAAAIARYTGMPHILIGATIVSIGTTLPEVVVSSIAAASHNSSIALGNSIGSILCNTGFIVAVTQLIKPSKITSRSFFVKGFLFIAYCLIFWFSVWDGTLKRIQALLLLILFLLYFLISMVEIRYKVKGSSGKRNGSPPPLQRKLWRAAQFLLGAVMIFIGGKYLVDYGVILARFIGISERVISLTLIALGTSLPELVTAVASLLKGHGGISLGNIIGANILDIVLVLGISGMIHPVPVPTAFLRLDIPAAFLLMAVLIIPPLRKRQVSRVQALLLLGSYFTYLFLIL